MRRKYLILSLLSLILAAVTACQDEPLSPESVITLDRVYENDFDKWLRANYVDPYNIEFCYKYNLNESDMNYFTVPSDLNSSIMMAHLVKYLCIESYDEVAGVDFTRAYFPKLFFLIGEFEYRNNGTMILGTAEGGKKIMLSGINYLPRFIRDAEYLNILYLQTIHHEFTHILNQTKDYPADYKQITGNGYVADQWSTAPFDTTYLKNGFISSYAQYADYEDFAEMLSSFVVHDASWWDAQLQAAGAEGAKRIGAKLDMVRTYMSESWGIDIYALRETIQRRQQDVTGGRLDLLNLSLN
ncbi:MAG: putative zinc-binding metallopeptidase [Bacteroidales bacterium]|nr:putative zinc-binding metallopeptidase [Bacteroidales bacterium]